MKLSAQKQSLPFGVRCLVLAAIATGGLVAGTQLAYAETIVGENCLADQYTGGGAPNCTANDVRVAGVAKDTNGNYLISQSECIAGSTFDLTATFNVVTTSQSRYDIGIYFDTAGDTEHDGAKTGTCSLSTIPNTPPPYYNLDGDSCGDNVQGTTLLVPITIPGVLCVDSNGDGLLDLPNAVSWQQNAGQVCNEAADVTAGAPSKCKLDNAFSVPVKVETVNLEVTKTANPTECNEPGCSVAFTVHVVNPATTTSVTLTTIVDDPDNNTNTLNDITYNVSEICGKTLLGPGESTDCTFTRTVSGDAGDSFVDKACVSGTDSNTPPNSVGPTCNTASVSINDVIPTATLEKTATGGVCAVERFNVKVTNTDTVEDLTLTALNDDKFGDITSIQGDVYGTTCGVASGVGTLLNETGAGTLSATVTANGGIYACQFDGFICKTDLPHTNTVTGALNDNDGNTVSPVGTAEVTTLTIQP